MFQGLSLTLKKTQNMSLCFWSVKRDIFLLSESGILISLWQKKKDDYFWTLWGSISQTFLPDFFAQAR